LPGRPDGRRMSRDVEVREFTALIPEDDEHEQQVKGEGWDDEEVDRDDVAGMSRQKGAPGRRRPR
jgi:hypothetical protein